MFPHVWNVLYTQSLANSILLLQLTLHLLSLPLSLPLSLHLSLHLSRLTDLGAKKQGKIRTSKISLRTFGTSEKKNNANTPAATPNDAAVSPLSPLLSASQCICPAQPRDVAIRGRADKEVGLVICTIVLYSWGRFHGC